MASIGVRPHRAANHGQATSFYYRDPDGNIVEFSCANFATTEEEVAFMSGPVFAANPSGLELDPDRFVARYRAGDPERRVAAPRQPGGGPVTRLVSTAKGIGRLEDDGETVALLDLDAADLGAALQAGLDIASIATAAVRDRVPVAQAQLIAPVPRPSKIWAVGYAYADHRTEVDYNGVAEEPVVFLKAPSSVIGTGEQIRFPKVAPDEVDYEGELAVVIGRRATDVSEADAYAFVAGFTIVQRRQRP